MENKTTIHSFLLLIKLLGLKKEPSLCVNKKTVYLLFLCNNERLSKYGTPISNFFCEQRKIDILISELSELIKAESNELDFDFLSKVDILAIELIASKFKCSQLSEIKEEIKKVTFHKAPVMPNPIDMNLAIMYENYRNELFKK